MSERSWIHRNSHHILSAKFRSSASLSILIYYYIVISLHNNIYCSIHHYYVLLVSIYSLLRISTSLRHFVQDFCCCCRSQYPRNEGCFIPLFPLQATLGLGAAAPPCRLFQHYSAWLLKCSACPAFFFHQFILSCSFISLTQPVINSFIYSFILSFLYAMFALI